MINVKNLQFCRHVIKNSTVKPVVSKVEIIDE